MNPNRPLSNNDYSDGEIYPLVPGSILDRAIRTEPWLNKNDAQRRRWLRLMNNPDTVFVGTVISEPRRQIELTIVLNTNNGVERRWMTNVMVTLDNFDRFIGSNNA